MRRGACFFCKEHGHLAKECPKKRGRWNGIRGKAPETKKPNGKQAFTQIRSMLKDLTEEERNEFWDQMDNQGLDF